MLQLSSSSSPAPPGRGTHPLAFADLALRFLAVRGAQQQLAQCHCWPRRSCVWCTGALRFIAANTAREVRP